MVTNVLSYLYSMDDVELAAISACHWRRNLLYDGPVIDPDDLWRIVAEEHVTAFGTSPAFLRMCENAGYSPQAPQP